MSQKNEALLFQSTVDIHFQNAHKNTKTAKAYSIMCVYWTGTMFRQITIAYFALAAPSTMLEAYVTTYMSDESKRGHVGVNVSKF